jgi:hypothetical protein
LVWLLLALTAFAFLPSAVMKIMRLPMVVEGFGKLGIPLEAIVPIGVLELICLILYLVPRTAVLGAFLLTGYLGGAIMVNIIGRADFLHAVAVGLLVWAGVWLRVPELRALLPLRRVNGGIA